MSQVLLGPAASAVESVALVLSERGGHYAEFLDAFNQAVTAAGGRPVRVVSIVAGSKPPEDAELGGAGVVIAVGAQAMRLLAGRESPPVLSVLVPRVSFDKLATETGRQRQRANFSAIYLDQPPARQFALIRQILPGKRRVALLAGPDSSALLPSLKSAAGRSGYELMVEEVASEQDLVPALKRLLPVTDMLLAEPDSVAFTRETVRPILLTAFRHDKPLIGFSQAYVTAGALAAVFSTPAQIARQAAELVRSLPEGRPALPAPLYPDHFLVAVNRYVARSLRLDIAPESVLVEALERAP